MKNIIFFHLKIIIFTAGKNCSISHRLVFVMKCTKDDPKTDIFLVGGFCKITISLPKSRSAKKVISISRMIAK